MQARRKLFIEDSAQPRAAEGMRASSEVSFARTTTEAAAVALMEELKMARDETNYELVHLTYSLVNLIIVGNTANLDGVIARLLKALISNETSRGYSYCIDYLAAHLPACLIKRPHLVPLYSMSPLKAYLDVVKPSTQSPQKNDHSQHRSTYSPGGSPVKD